MLTKLILASLVPVLATTTAAHADDKAQLRPSPMFEIDAVATQTHAHIVSETVWINGAWTLQDYRAKTPRTTSGRLTEDQLRELRDELARTTWSKTYNRRACPPLPTITTEFSAGGKLVWTEPSCGADLDQASAQSLARIRTLLAAAIAPEAAPQCAPSGTPLVELDENESTWAVYRDGAWTLDLHAAAGQPAMRQLRCLNKTTIAKIEADLAKATWTISHPMHCAAVSIDYLTIKVGGKSVFTERTCNPDQLDATSARMLADIERLMDFAQPPACLPGGPTPLVELDYLDLRAHSDQRTVTLADSGAWTADVTVDGRLVRRTAGCLTGDALARIAKAVKDSSWSVTKLAVTCRAMSVRSTVVKVDGKQILVERLCGAEQLDADSAKALHEIEKLLADATK